MEKKYEKTKRLSEEKFKRLIGITRETFKEMVGVLSEALSVKHKRGGRPPKLDIEDMLLLALEYWRQYITFSELGFNYGVAESTAHDIVVWVEGILIESERFRLPGKKALCEAAEIEIVLVDVTESPVERPKKNNGNGTLAKRNGTL